MATFESALPAAAVLTLTKGATDTGVKAVIDEARTTATFTSASKYAVGTYTVTATAGESKQSKDVEIKEQSVQDIVIKSKQALTDENKKKLYVYYDVVDQYGESMRASTSLTWNSGTGPVKADKSTGCLTITKNAGDDTEFTYGTNIYIVGVDTKSGKSVQATIPVGMVRALDTIKFEGFVNSDDKGTILETLPKDFAVGKYSLLFTAYDQDGNEMEADKSFTDATKPKVTFIADNPTLIKAEFKQGDIYTIKGRKYCSVTVEPGMYIDKGGEVNITAISNTTGNRTTKNFVIGAGAILQSLSLSAPTETVADGDTWVNIPYVAKDTSGNDVTNYETIVRSTNQLKLTTSAGKLTVLETDSGTAEIRWDDSEKATDFKTSSSHDGVDRPVSLVTTVIGGESSNIMMYVSDTRRPVAVSSVKLNNDNNDTITENNEVEINFFSDAVKYIDQYGKVLDDNKAQAFFNETKSSGNGFDSKQYGVKADYSAIGNNIDIKALTSSAIDVANEKFVVLKNDGNNKKLKISTNPISGNRAAVENIRYSVVRLENENDNVRRTWDAVDANLSVDYTIVPVRGLSDLRINNIPKIRLETDYTYWENGDAIEAASGSSIALSGNGKDVATVETKRDLVVAGTYDGKTVTIPNEFYATIGKDKEGKATFVVTKDGAHGNAKITGLIDYTDWAETAEGSVRYNDLYDFNTARHTRRDARKSVSVKVYGTASDDNSYNETDLLGTVRASVALSDAISYPVSISFCQYNAVANKLTLRAWDTGYTFKDSIPVKAWPWDANWGTCVIIRDQYDDVVTDKNVEFSVTNYVENSGEFAHLPKSFAVSQNNSHGASLSGVEIKDTFDLTATVEGTSVSTKVPVTMGADYTACVDSAGNENERTWQDENGTWHTLRETLGYDR